MTLQSNAHPRLEPVFDNGARRADYEAAIALFFEMLEPLSSAPVADFVKYAEYLDLPGLDYKQMARVLSQKADRGELGRFTGHGRYYYYLPVEGVRRERIE